MTVSQFAGKIVFYLNRRPLRDSGLAGCPELRSVFSGAAGSSAAAESKIWQSTEGAVRTPSQISVNRIENKERTPSMGNFYTIAGEGANYGSVVRSINAAGATAGYETAATN